jgi:thiamine kinase
MQTKLSKHDAQAILESVNLYGTVNAVSYIEKGLSNRNYHIQMLEGTDYLLKHYTCALPEGSIAIHQRMAKLGLSTRLTALCRERNMALFEFERITRPACKTDISSILTKLVALHNLDSVAGTLDLNSALTNSAKTSAFNMFKTRVNEALMEISNHPRHHGLCHNDLTLDNVLVSNDDSLLIDFDYAQFGDVFFDLAALSHSFNLNEKEQRRLIEKYCSYANINYTLSDAINKLQGYLLIYRVLCMSWYEQHGYDELASEIASVI